MQILVVSTSSVSSSCSYAPPTSCFLSRSGLTKWVPASEDLARRSMVARPSRSSPVVVVSAFFGLGGGKGISAKSTGKGCFSCAGKGAIECQGCKGTGKNKKNGNMFERWKCYDCQGFGLVGCPKCGTGGLTPEQRGER